nr:hypothetical protein [Tanacetum cinerariifolium]
MDLKVLDINFHGALKILDSARHGDTLAWACRMCIGIGGDHGPQTEPPILSVEPHKNLSTRSSCKDSQKSTTMCGLRYLKQLGRTSKMHHTCREIRTVMLFRLISPYF